MRTSCGAARLLEGPRNDHRDRLMVVLNVWAEQLGGVEFALGQLAAFSAVTMASTPDAALARLRSLEAILPFAMAEPTT